MGKSAFIVRDGDTQHQTIIGDRDIGLLFGPFFIEGMIFSWNFGFYENFSVAGGIPKGAHVLRRGRNLLRAALALQRASQRDNDLLQFDYLFSVGDDRPRKGPESVVIGGRSGLILTHPDGFCYVQMTEAAAHDRRTVQIIDLRIVKDLVADGCGSISVHQKSAIMVWPEVLPPLIDFLRPRKQKTLIVELVDRVK
jgi:hypothetical protein